MKTVVIGGGITGLACALRLEELKREKNLPLEIALLEAGGRLGGVIATLQEDGAIFELGPDAIFTEKPWGLDFLKKLGLEQEIIGTNLDFRRSFVAKGNRLYPVPEGFYILAPSQIWPFAASPLFTFSGKLRALCDLWIPRKTGSKDESLGSFVRRRLGQEVLDRMAQPMAAGIYSADPETLSLAATFPRFMELERQYGSVIRGLSRGNHFKESEKARGPRYSLFVSLKNGMETAVEASKKRLSSTEIRFNSGVKSIERKDRGFMVSGDGFQIKADAVCLAVSSLMSADITKNLNPDLSILLKKIPYHSSGTVNLLYPRSAIRHPLDGFGFVVPALENRSILGCTFATTKFPGRAPEGRALLRAFIGGPGCEELLSLSDPEILKRVKKDLNELLGIQGEPKKAFVARAQNSMPQYLVGHLEKIKEIKEICEKIPGLELAGNAYDGIGIPDCIRSGETAAEKVLSHLEIF